MAVSSFNFESAPYRPGTEDLGGNEIRITALGTGQPTPNPAQVNAGWLIELGNGDKFIFDFGFGTQVNFSALKIPYTDITACFTTHLHSDHIGDFGLIWVGGWVSGRTTPLKVVGPSGANERHGVAHFVTRQVDSFAWDHDTRSGILPPDGGRVETTEFDFSRVGEVYNHNGVVVKSFPAVHNYDGCVSYRLEWNGLSVVYSGDTVPSRFMVENAQDADVIIHETFNSTEQLIDIFGYSDETARQVAMGIHSIPDHAAFVVNQCNPRLFVGFHCFNNQTTRQGIIDAVRIYYDGPFILAEDLMVLNVEADGLRARKAEIDRHVYPAASRTTEYKGAPQLRISKWLSDARIVPPEQ